MVFEKREQDREMEIDKNIVGSIHPITFEALERLRDNKKGNLGKFEEFLKDWINKEKKEAQQDLARRFNERTSSYHKELLTELLEEN